MGTQCAGGERCSTSAARGDGAGSRFGARVVTAVARRLTAGLVALALVASALASALAASRGAPPTRPGKHGPAATSAARALRSANLSHITGTSRKIQLYIKNRHLQLLPDGVVNGTVDENSDYTILQRTTVSVGQIKIQGAATCLFLCMDACGFPYSSKDFSDECVFNEMLEQHYYNTYSSARHSGSKRTMYLALDARGRPRRVALPARRALGKLSGYVRVLTRPAPNGTMTTCTRTAKAYTPPPPHNQPRHGCRNKKKKKRKCREGEKPNEQCELAPQQAQQPKNIKKQINNKEPLVNRHNVTNVHARHKRPLKPKKINRQPDPNGPNKKKRPKIERPAKKGSRKVGRALEDPHPVHHTTTGSWEAEEEAWMSTSDEMLSSTHMDDGAPWELTTNSGFNREFFRQASAVQETAEEDDK